MAGIQQCDMFEEVCSYENLEHAFKRARKGKSFKSYVVEFEKELQQNLLQLRSELLMQIYAPKPLVTFILRDPKTRKISKSDFRDRVVHHALCRIIEPLFDKCFIHDSYANRIGKGTLKAIQRFDVFKRRVSKNNTVISFILKADIKHYFETVDHDILLSIIEKKITDKRVLWLIKMILSNYHTSMLGKGMPLGNLTSQFFANVYLNELDQFVKHKLKVRCYIRYVDDFVLLDNSKKTLEMHKVAISNFLRERLSLELHPNKCKILVLNNGVGFLGFRIFFYHRLVRRKNLRKFEKRFEELKKLYKSKLIDKEEFIERFEGWLAYVSHANTYKYRIHLTKLLALCFAQTSSQQVVKNKKEESFDKKAEAARFPFSSQQSAYFLKKGLSITETSKRRNIKESTVWGHLAKLIEYNQLSVWKMLPREKIIRILQKIRSHDDTLTQIKERLNDSSISFDDINCVLASVKCRSRRNPNTTLKGQK